MKSLCSMEIDRNIEDLCVGGAVVVVAKCPIAGVSKTRLAPLLGAEGAALLAQAMLSDILVSLSECVSISFYDWAFFLLFLGLIFIT
jgi:hypothetical protein